MIANRDPPYAQRLSTKKEMVEPKQQATIREAAEAANMRRITSLGTAQREALAAAAEAKRREVNLEFKLDLERASLKVARKGFEGQRARTAQDHKAQLARLADASRQSQLEKENLQEELKELKDALARVKKECERSKEECESSKEATQGHQEECEQLRNDLVNARNESDSVRTELENTQRGLEQAKQELEQSKREIAQMTGERACSPEHDEETRSEASIDSALEPLFGTSPALSRKLIEVMEEFGEFPFFPLCTA